MVLLFNSVLVLTRPASALNSDGEESFSLFIGIFIYYFIICSSSENPIKRRRYTSVPSSSSSSSSILFYKFSISICFVRFCSNFFNIFLFFFCFALCCWCSQSCSYKSLKEYWKGLLTYQGILGNPFSPSAMKFILFLLDFAPSYHHHWIFIGKYRYKELFEKFKKWWAMRKVKHFPFFFSTTIFNLFSCMEDFVILIPFQLFHFEEIELEVRIYFFKIFYFS